MDKLNLRMAGYDYLIEKYQIKVIQQNHISIISDSNIFRTNNNDGVTEEIFPNSYWPGTADFDQLEFALKYDGINLGIIFSLFEVIDQKELISYIKSKPTGKYARRIWFLFEYLTGITLPLENLKIGNYIEILEPDLYYTTEKGERVQRFRITNNLLGTKDFCPIVRRSEKLKKAESENLNKKCESVAKSYPPQLLRRALSYLYSKETKSSFEIENIKPTASRTEKFVNLLELAEKQDFCKKQQLIELQNRIVDQRFIDNDYRRSQNYIGQAVEYQKEIIHYICPKPEDVSELMNGLLSSHLRMKENGISALIHTAVISYGFVFIHPFEDGNGRIHRFLIHNLLSIRGMIPQGLMFPVSAAILKNPAEYDRSLESFSRPLLKQIEYSLDNNGKMSINGETGHFYKYIDMTPQAEALAEFVKLTIEIELVEELNFLANYDKARLGIQEIIDMPDNLIDLFIKLSLQNKGYLSVRKRQTHFVFLTDEELKSMEKVIMTVYFK